MEGASVIRKKGSKRSHSDHTSTSSPFIKTSASRTGGQAKVQRSRSHTHGRVSSVGTPNPVKQRPDSSGALRDVSSSNKDGQSLKSHNPITSHRRSGPVVNPSTIHRTAKSPNPSSIAQSSLSNPKSLSLPNGVRSWRELGNNRKMHIFLGEFANDFI